MKKQALALALIVCSLFTACAQTKKTTASKTKATSTKVAANLRGLSEVMMRRGACFGRCPEYTITIYKTGRVVYAGTRNATPLGTYQKELGAATTQALLQKFMDHRVDTCRAYYISRIADAPTMSFTLVINGKQQIIGNAHFGPHFLIDLADEVDVMGKVDSTWTKLADAPKPD